MKISQADEIRMVQESSMKIFKTDDYIRLENPTLEPS